MSKFNIRGSELKALLKLARKQPVAFAYNPGKSPKEDYFGLHRQKSAEIIMKQARSDGPSNKVAFGTFTIDGKEMSLICQKTLPALAKKLRAYLRAEKSAFSIRVFDADGSELESDLDEADVEGTSDTSDETAVEAPEQQVAPQPDAPDSTEAPQADSAAAPDEVSEEAALKQRLASLAAEAEPSGLAKVLLPKAAKSLMRILKAGDIAKAGKLLDALEQKLAAGAHAEGGAQAEQRAQNWEKTRTNLLPKLERAGQANPEIAEKLTKAWSDVCKQADAGHYENALKMAAKLASVLQKQLDRAQAATTQKKPAKEDRMPALAALERRVDSLLAALA